MPGPESAISCTFEISPALVGISSNGIECDPLTGLAVPGEPIVLAYKGVDGIIGVVSPPVICDAQDTLAEVESCYGTTPVMVNGRASLPLKMSDFINTGMIANATADNGTPWYISTAEASKIELTQKAAWDIYWYDHALGISISCVLGVSALVGASFALKWLFGGEQNSLKQSIPVPNVPAPVTHNVPSFSRRSAPKSPDTFARDVAVRLDKTRTLKSRNEFDNDSS